MCSTFLGNITDAFVENPELTNLLFDDFFRNAIHNAQVWRRSVVIVAKALVVVIVVVGVVVVIVSDGQLTKKN